MTESFSHRYCAAILVQAAAPLKIGTGEVGLTVDELVATDANGLPMIPGTALCGVLRHSLARTSKGERINDLFGFQENDDEKTGSKIQENDKRFGSRIIVTDARMVGEEGQVIDGLHVIEFSSVFYSKFKNLTVRDHCRINERGVADSDNRGKFDSQVVYKGARFVFEIELIGDEKDKEKWQILFEHLNSRFFQIGGGTRKGFGELQLIKVAETVYNLSSVDDRDAYLNKSSRLTVPNTNDAIRKIDSTEIEGGTFYKLSLKPDDYFIFSSGYGDKEVDDVAKKEIVIDWVSHKDTLVERPRFSKEKCLIPATSLKGAISHRTAFYFNKLLPIYADQLPAGKCAGDYSGENNLAVKALFGCAKNSREGSESGQRGRILISDVYIEDIKEKIFNHVAIDRFTGGAIDGALFDEKVTNTSSNITLMIIVENEAFNGDDKIQQTLEAALKDITTGMLPLGGKTMRGHGCFRGTVTKNGEVI